MAANLDPAGQQTNSNNNAHCVTVSYDSCESLKSSVSSRGNNSNNNVAGTSSSTANNYGVMINNHNRHKRISILKRLKEKLSSADSLTMSSTSTYADPGVYQDANGQPTIIRIGTVSSGTSTVRSWRVVDDFLRNRFDFSSPSRQSTVSNRSMSSGKTFIYDDKSLEINKPDFCTVIKVEDCPSASSSTEPPAAGAQSLTAAPTPASLENVNVIIEQRRNNDSSSSLNSSPAIMVRNNNIHLRTMEGPSGSGVDSCNSSGENNKPDQCQINSREHDHAQTMLRNSLLVAPPNESPPIQTLRNCSSSAATAMFHPLPSIILPPTLSTVVSANGLFPTQPRLCASGGSPIELTNWRARADFDADPTSRAQGDCNNNNNNSSNGNQRSDQSSAGGFNLNLLTPDDLPRLYPGWNIPMPPPFRFDEEFEEEPKGCCGSSRFSHSMLIRVFIAVISLIGLACVIVGIVLGALTVSGSTRLTLCLLMIGVGVVLIIVSGIAWRLTSLDPSVSPSCWTILGLRAQRPQSVFPERRSRTAYYRVRNVRRPAVAAPFCGIIQSEFAWRPPPPTYQATMQEMRLQNFLCARNRVTGPSGSPPPTYRSDNNDVDARPSLNEFIQRISRPPSYRSHESIQAASIEERPLLPTDVQNNDARQQQQQQQQQQRQEQNPDLTLSENVSEGSAVVNTERVHNDDRAKLMAHDHLQQTNSNEHLPSTSSGDSPTSSLERQQQHQTPSSTPVKRETVSVIDCSAAEPIVTVGVDVPLRSTRPVAVTSPQNPRQQPSSVAFSSNNRRHGYHSETMPMPHRTTTSVNAPPPPYMIPRGMIRPAPPRDDFALRYHHPPSVPFAAGVRATVPHLHHTHHHARPPLMPIRVGPNPALRWRLPPQNVTSNLQQQMQHYPQRLPTVAASVVRDDQQQHHATNAAVQFSADTARGDPSYV